MIGSLTYRPIGVVRSPFTCDEGTPIQPAAAAGVEGTIEIEIAYAPALADLDGFERHADGRFTHSGNADKD